MPWLNLVDESDHAHERLHLVAELVADSEHPVQIASRQACHQEEVDKHPENGQHGVDELVDGGNDACDETHRQEACRDLDATAAEIMWNRDLLQVGQRQEDGIGVDLALHSTGDEPHAPVRKVWCCERVDGLAVSVDLLDCLMPVHLAEALRQASGTQGSHRAVDALVETLLPEDVQVIGERMLRVHIALSVVEGSEVTV